MRSALHLLGLFEDETDSCPEMSVRYYYSTPRKIPNKRRSQGLIIIIIIIKSIVPSRNMGCLLVLSTSVYRLLRTLVHSSFYPLPSLSIFSSYFSVFLSSWFPEGSKVGQPLVSVYPHFLNVWPIHLNFLFLISTFISSCPVTFHRSLLEVIFGHHILIYILDIYSQRFVFYAHKTLMSLNL